MVLLNIHIKHQNHLIIRIEKGCHLFQNKAGLAKMRGQNVKLRPDWEKVKVNIMKKLLYKKFMYLHLRYLLLLTQDEDLEEGNYHNDNFWGNCRCKKCKDIPGQNMLGKLLMEIRKELKEDKT